MTISRFAVCLALLFSGANIQGASGKNAKRPLTIWLCGDMMTGRGVAPFLKTQQTSLTVWRDQIRNADIAFCNLEGAFGNDKQRIQQREKPRLLLDKSTPQILKNAGFDIVSQANNHALDGGENGLRQLQSALRKSRIATVGAQFNADFRPLRMEVRGQSVMLLAASQWGNFRAGKAQVRALQHSNLIEQVRALSQRGERVLVSLHWGIEYSKSPTAGQRQVAHALIDAGALAVIGHHPHVAQSVETYKHRPIFYSLGNFLFDRTPRAQSGIAALLMIDEKHVSWRTFAVSPQAGIVDASTRNISQSMRENLPTLPDGERVVQSADGQFLRGEKRRQRLIWSRTARGHQVLRLYLLDSDEMRATWRVVARGFPQEARALRIGDIDGDGSDEFALELWQRSKLDVSVRRRLHIYSARVGAFIPRWRGSALSRPFREWCLVARSKHNGHDVAAIEYSNSENERGFERLTIYRWNGFGFRALWSSPARGTLRYLRSGRDQHGIWLRVTQRFSGQDKHLVLRSGGDAVNETFRAQEENRKHSTIAAKSGQN